MDAPLAVVEPTHTPAQLMRHATDVAGLCKAIVTKTAKKIGERKYVPIEGWQAVATAHGCMLSINLVEDIGDGIRAVAEVKRMEDGRVLATAEGFVGHQENPWSKRELYARRAMAQTRAMSRAARSAFAHVVVLMDAGLETTPAEEIEGTDNREPVRTIQQPARKTAAPAAHDPAPAQQSAPSQPAANPDTGELSLTIREAASVPKITSGKKGNGQPWKRWAYQSPAASCWLGTFDTNFGALLEQSAESGKELEVVYEPNSKGGGDIIQAKWAE